MNLAVRSCNIQAFCLWLLCVLSEQLLLRCGSFGASGPEISYILIWLGKKLRKAFMNEYSRVAAFREKRLLLTYGIRNLELFQ